jgi:methyl-accepting chemotaxis protein
MQLSFKQKIVFSIMGLSLIPLVLFAGQMLYLKYQEAQKTTHTRLTTMAEEYAERVESDFNKIHAQTRLLSAMTETRAALKAFSAGYAALDTSNLDDRALRQRYAYQQEKTPGSNASDVENWLPTDARTRALQQLYITSNPNPIGAKEKLDAAPDGSPFSEAHAKYHPYFRDFVEEFGFYDLFLINAEGVVVYTNFKEIDLGSNVKTGPLANTNFSALVRQALASNNDEESLLSNFAPYLPSYNASAAFTAVPIVEDGVTIGAVALQLPVDKLNAIFDTATNLGETTDAFILNKDGTFLTKTARLAYNPGDTGPASLTESLQAVFTDDYATMIHFTSAKGKAVTASAQPLHVSSKSSHGAQSSSTDHLSWAVVVRIENSEVMSGFMQTVWIVLGILAATALAVVVIGWWLARSLVKPVAKLGANFYQSAERVGRATGQVGDAVNGMIAASEETSAQSVVIRKNSAEAAGFVSGVTAAVEELNVSIGDISQSISETNVLIDDAVEKARKTNEVVRNLGQAAKKITEVVSLINDLAEQTNLLALNAAIEAARAGDAGRGFAVVADEVKKLASHTSQATVDIREQVREIQDVSEQSVVALQAVVEAIHRIRDNATTVSAAVEEQSGVAKQIAGSVRDAADRVKQVDDNMTGIEQAANDTGVAADQVSGSVTEVQAAFTEMKSGVQATLDQMGVK